VLSPQLADCPHYRQAIQPEMAAAPTSHPWFAIRVKSRYEKITSTALRNKGYEEFAPMYRRRRHWSDRIKEVELPLFPGYIFSRFDPVHRLPILTTPGIVTIVGTGNKPQPVDDDEIARIQTIITSGALASPWPFLRTGQKVLITSGPLCGIEGFLVSVKNQHRLVVSVMLLQRSVSAEIDWDSVRSAS